MPENLGSGNADLPQRPVDEVRLRLGRPNRSAWARAVAESRTIKRNDTMLLRRHLDETARCEVLNHAAIAVQQNDRFARASIDIVKPDAVYIYKPACRWIFALRLLRERAVHQRSYAQRRDGSRDRQRVLRQRGAGGRKRAPYNT